MKTSTIHQLLELVAMFVNNYQPWREKRDEILNEASDEEKISLQEFAAWFGPEQKAGEGLGE